MGKEKTNGAIELVGYVVMRESDLACWNFNTSCWYTSLNIDCIAGFRPKREEMISALGEPCMVKELKISITDWGDLDD